MISLDIGRLVICVANFGYVLILPVQQLRYLTFLLLPCIDFSISVDHFIISGIIKSIFPWNFSITIRKHKNIDGWFVRIIHYLSIFITQIFHYLSILNGRIFYYLSILIGRIFHYLSILNSRIFHYLSILFHSIQVKQKFSRSLIVIVY